MQRRRETGRFLGSQRHLGPAPAPPQAAAAAAAAACDAGVGKQMKQRVGGRPYHYRVCVRRGNVVERKNTVRMVIA